MQIEQETTRYVSSLSRYFVPVSPCDDGKLKLGLNEVGFGGKIWAGFRKCQRTEWISNVALEELYLPLVHDGVNSFSLNLNGRVQIGVFRYMYKFI